MLKKVPRVRSRQAKSPAPPRKFNQLGTMVGQAFSLPGPFSASSRGLGPLRRSRQRTIGVVTEIRERTFEIVDLEIRETSFPQSLLYPGPQQAQGGTHSCAVQRKSRIVVLIAVNGCEWGEAVKVGEVLRQGVVSACQKRNERANVVSLSKPDSKIRKKRLQ